MLGSACATAPTLTVAGFGTAAGAVYSPVPSTVPFIALPPGVPFTFQLTCGLVVPLTCAVNCWFPFVNTDVDVGLMAMVTDAMLTLAEAVCRQSAWETAVTVTVGGFGIDAGAV